MRMEELSEHRYEKTADTVERYLLNLVKEYFDTTSYKAPSSREYIIDQAVRRLKEEITYENLGVLSIKLPNDEEPRTGKVTITLEDLGAEPRIEDKKTAFNKDFGNTIDTVCEGNDPRLSDARQALPHNHTTDNINGLSGTLSTLTTKVQRIEGSQHTHSNLPLLDKLTYSGDKSVIDLSVVDNYDAEMQSMVNSITDDITAYDSRTDEKIAQVRSKITETQNKIQECYSYINTKNTDYLNQSKTYTDNKVTNLLSDLQTELDKCVKIETLTTLKNSLKNSYVYAATQRIDIGEVFDNNNFSSNTNTKNGYSVSYSTDIDDAVLNQISLRNNEVEDCRFEFYISYDGYTYQMPHAFMDNIGFNGSISAGVDTTNYEFNVKITSEYYEIPDIIQGSFIIIKVFCKNLQEIS